MSWVYLGDILGIFWGEAEGGEEVGASVRRKAVGEAMGEEAGVKVESHVTRKENMHVSTYLCRNIDPICI